MRTEGEIEVEVESLKVKLQTCFRPKHPESMKWAEGFIAGLEWVLE